MERGNTKQEILEAALEMFSVQGFEATSISQIASAVGIRKASLYSHFENKQASTCICSCGLFSPRNWNRYVDDGN